jgi:6-phosphogluconolactonase (cycloisomerase 2 family)
MLIDWPQTLTGDAPTQLAITESGSHLLCLESTASVVAVYAVDPLTGALEVLPGTFNSVGAGAVALAVDPIGGTVFVAGASGSAIRAFSLDASDGTLLDLGFAAPGSTPTSMRVDPSGSFLYAARADGTLARIAFDSGAGFGVLQSLSASGAQLELGVHTVVR